MPRPPRNKSVKDIQPTEQKETVFKKTVDALIEGNRTSMEDLAKIIRRYYLDKHNLSLYGVPNEEVIRIYKLG